MRPSALSISAPPADSWSGFGFTAIGGEWYTMWQSQVWNGQQAAFRIAPLILLTVIFVGQQDCEPLK
jgi:predicted small integral membrane protein